MWHISASVAASAEVPCQISTCRVVYAKILKLKFVTKVQRIE